MKHNKLSISIVSAFIAALGLTACSNVSVKKEAILSYVNYDKETSFINKDDIFNKIKYSEDGLTSFYNAVLEVMIRDYYQAEDQSSELKGFMDSAKNDLEADHKNAKNNAKANGTKYKEEWQAILDAAGVKDEKGLLEKHVYDYEKEAYTKKFSLDQRDNLTQEFIGFDDEGHPFKGETAKYARSVYPYHVRHILVKTEGADANDFVTGKITKDQALNLADAVKRLASGNNTFGQVAFEVSDDEGSRVKYGDSGIMTTKTSFVNEFKLGIYAFDNIYGKKITGDESLKTANEKLGLKGNLRGTEDTIADKLTEIGVAKVPYGVFQFLEENADVETDKNGKTVNDGEAKFFPRNVMWNQYLNIHNVFVITDEDVEGYNCDVPAIDPNSNSAGFRAVDNIIGVTVGADGTHINEANPTKVLTDEDGRVIIGVRSEYGIHFMITERTPFEIKNGIKSYNLEEGAKFGKYTHDTTTINEYYTTEYDINDTSKNTFVNYLNSDGATLSERSKTVKDEIKGFDELYDYRLFKQLQSLGKVKFVDPEIEKGINTLIERKYEKNAWSDEQTINTTWNTYLNKIDLQYQIRGEENGDDSRLVKVVCALGYKNGNENDEFTKKEGACYYEA